jgi:hypothetical protein
LTARKSDTTAGVAVWETLLPVIVTAADELALYVAMALAGPNNSMILFLSLETVIDQIPNVNSIGSAHCSTQPK